MTASHPSYQTEPRVDDYIDALPDWQQAICRRLIPLKAVVLNLLSVGAAYGMLVLVFQHHWAEGILAFHSNGAIASWLPLFLFVILFGLSMDYHVLILSRVKELVDGGMSTEQAVTTGIKRTASTTVTCAAIVMVAIFSMFITLRTLELKQAGFGLAAAVLMTPP